MAMTDTKTTKVAEGQDTRLAMMLAIVTGLAGGLGFALYSLFGGDVLTSMIETTMMWCM